MADGFLQTFKDFAAVHRPNGQQQAHCSGDNVAKYEQLLTSGHGADYSKLVHSDCESHEVLSMSISEADLTPKYVVRDLNRVSGENYDFLSIDDHADITNCKSSAAVEVKTVKNDDYLTGVDVSDNKPSTSTSRDSTSTSSMNSLCSEPKCDNRTFDIVDSDNYTIINDKVDRISPNELVSDAAAADFYLIPIENRCDIERQFDYCEPVEHVSTLADYLGNANVVDATSASCSMLCADKVSATQLTSKSLKLAVNNNKSYLVVIGDSLVILLLLI